MLRGWRVRKPKPRRVAKALDAAVNLSHQSDGPYLQFDGVWFKLTPTRVRKLVAALMPYAEWTPDLYGKDGGK